MSPPSETEVRGSRRARQLGLSIGVVLFLVLLLLPGLPLDGTQRRVAAVTGLTATLWILSLIHISEPTRPY